MSPEQIQSLLNVNTKSKNQVQCVSFGICEARQMLGGIKIAGSYKTAKYISDVEFIRVLDGQHKYTLRKKKHISRCPFQELRCCN